MEFFKKVFENRLLLLTKHREPLRAFNRVIEFKFSFLLVPVTCFLKIATNKICKRS